MAYKLLLFDFDGTLVDTVGDIAFYVNEVLAGEGQSGHSVERVKEAIGWGVHELFKELAPEFSSDTERLERAVEAFKRCYREKPVLKSRPFEGVQEILEGDLSKAVKGIVTNKPQDITLQILDELGLRKHFKSVIGMHAGFPAKPDPAALLHLMNLLGFSAKETIYIGDSPIDGETSTAAGVDFAWMSYGYHALDGAKPVYRFSSAKEWGVLVK